MKRRTAATLSTVVAIVILGHTINDAEAGARRSRPLKTGQTTCSNSTGKVISCDGTGQDGEFRRGEPRAYLDRGDGTIKDNRTALVWEKLSDDGSMHDKDTQYTWDQAFEKIEALNTAPCLGNVCDWRLPNRFELESILDSERTPLAVGTAFTVNCAPGCSILSCSCTGDGPSWTSTSFGLDRSYALIVNFNNTIAGPIIKTYRFVGVRAVRGGDR